MTSAPNVRTLGVGPSDRQRLGIVESFEFATALLSPRARMRVFRRLPPPTQEAFWDEIAQTAIDEVEAGAR